MCRPTSPHIHLRASHSQRARVSELKSISSKLLIWILRTAGETPLGVGLSCFFCAACQLKIIVIIAASPWQKKILDLALIYCYCWLVWQIILSVVWWRRYKSRNLVEIKFLFMICCMCVECACVQLRIQSKLPVRKHEWARKLSKIVQFVHKNCKHMAYKLIARAWIQAFTWKLASLYNVLLFLHISHLEVFSRGKYVTSSMCICFFPSMKGEVKTFRKMPIYTKSKYIFRHTCSPNGWGRFMLSHLHVHLLTYQAVL